MQEKICKWTFWAGALAVFLALSSCATPPSPVAPPPAVQSDPEFPFNEFLQAEAAGQPLLRIAPELSLVTITVRRGGPLARMGHDHVVASRHVEGFAAPGWQRGALRFRLDQLTVDEPALRSEAGLQTQPSADAVDGTRRNMLARVLDAERFPWLLVRAELAPGAAGLLRADITLHGVTRQYLVPATITQHADRLDASGAFTLKQSDFGITPFAVFGGALAVQDELELRFAISARR